MLAAYRDTAYKLVLLLHVVGVIVAVAPAVVHPILLAVERRRADADLVGLAGRLSSTARIYVIALIVSGLIGFGLISMSDDVIAWGDTWVWLSIVLWVVLNGVVHGALIPAERALAEGDTTATKRLDQVAPIIAILVLVLTYLMVVKPGGGGL